MTAPRRPPGRSAAGTGGGCDGQLRSRPRSRSSDAEPPPGHRNRHPRSPLGGGSSLHRHGYQISAAAFRDEAPKSCSRSDSRESVVTPELAGQATIGRPVTAAERRAPPQCRPGWEVLPSRCHRPARRSGSEDDPVRTVTRVRPRPGPAARGVPVGPLGGRPPRRPSRNITSPTKTAPSPISAPAPPR